MDRDKFAQVYNVSVIFGFDDLQLQFLEVIREVHQFGNLKEIFHFKHYLLINWTFLIFLLKDQIGGMGLEGLLNQPFGRIKPTEGFGKKEKIQLLQNMQAVLQRNIEDVLENLMEIDCAQLDLVDFAYF